MFKKEIRSLGKQRMSVSNNVVKPYSTEKKCFFPHLKFNGLYFFHFEFLFFRWWWGDHFCLNVFCLSIKLCARMSFLWTEGCARSAHTHTYQKIIIFHKRFQTTRIQIINNTFSSSLCYQVCRNSEQVLCGACIHSIWHAVFRTFEFIVAFCKCVYVCVLRAVLFSYHRYAMNKYCRYVFLFSFVFFGKSERETEKKERVAAGIFGWHWVQSTS